jgi:hypothetical protein
MLIRSEEAENIIFDGNVLYLDEEFKEKPDAMIRWALNSASQQLTEW